MDLFADDLAGCLGDLFWVFFEGFVVVILGVFPFGLGISFSDIFFDLFGVCGFYRGVVLSLI